MKVNSLQNFSKGKPLKVDAKWEVSTARFFGDGREWSTPEWYALGKMPCDGIFLREEVTSHGTRWEEPGLRTEIRRVKSGFEVTTEATLYNPKTNHDKLVTLAYELLAVDGAVVASESRTQRTPANAKSGNNVDCVFLLFCRRDHARRPPQVDDNDERLLTSSPSDDLVGAAGVSRQS